VKIPGLYGLVLLGGKSSRMGRDKSALIYSKVSNVDQRRRCFELLDAICEKTFVSCRSDQASAHSVEFPVIVDSVAGEGPGAGILSAANEYPDASWLVLACDFPFADAKAVGFLARQQSSSQPATFYVHENQMVEPLFAVWHKPALEELRQGFAHGDFSPRRALERIDQVLGCQRLRPPMRQALVNVNSPEESREHGLT
jgi:molybdopterin-guanine dinucleotide biosynthesis protein A